MSDGFVNLHLHTNKSLLDGMIKADELMKKTLDFNQIAVAVTDHGNMYSIVDAHKEAKKQGQKFITGVELYTVKDHTIKGKAEGDSEATANRNHLIMLAKNKSGYQKMCRIVSKGYTDGFYYRPRVDRGIFEEFVDKKENDLIVSSACFVKGTKVTTENGIKNIEDVVKGDKVLTHKGVYKEVESPTQREYSAMMCNVKTLSGLNVECTSDHKFLVVSEYDATTSKTVGRYYKENVTSKMTEVENNALKSYSVVCKERWKEAFFLQRDDFLLTPINEEVKDVTELEITLYKYVKNDYVAYQKQIKITDEFLEFIGFCCANGKLKTMNFDKAKFGFYFISLKDDEQSYVFSLAKKFFGITPTIKDDCCFFSDSVSYEFFRTHIGNSIPNFVKTLPYKRQMKFIKGYFKNNINLNYPLNNAGYLQLNIPFEHFYDMMHIMHRNYITFIAKEYNGIYHLTIGNGLVTRLADFINGKTDEYERFSLDNPISCLPIEIDGVMYMKHRVVHVNRVMTDGQTQIVHCLKVKDVHSFTANGIAVHNCLAGEIPQHIMKGDIESAKEVVLYYQNLFNGNFYLEIQPMESYQQYIVNKAIIEMSKDLSVPIIATTDAHYLNYEDKETHDVLLCLQSSSLRSDHNRWYFPGNSYYVMNREEITDYFKRKYQYKLIKKRNTKKNASSEFKFEYVHNYDGEKFTNPDKTIKDFVEVVEEGEFNYSDLDQNVIAQSIAETENVANQCNFEIELGKHYLPKIDIPSDNEHFNQWRSKLSTDNKVNEDYLRYLCIKGLKKLGLTSQEYRERLEYELGVINSMDFPDYFLIYYDIAKFCADENIPIGPGRGCFVPTSMVNTQNGNKYIADIDVGDVVFGVDEQQHEVVDLMSYDVEEDVVSFNVEDKKIDGATLDHKIYAIKKVDYDNGIRNPQWYAANELEVGDYIAEV